MYGEGSDTESEDEKSPDKARIVRALQAQGGGKTNIGDYKVGRAVGKGKFSTVFHATLQETGEECALKKISVFTSMDTIAQEKCLKEVKLLQSLEHKNIVQYRDAFIDNDALNIVFEWASAGDLKRQIRKAIEKGMRFEERVIWKYFLEICRAIQHIHSKRIIHRDIKPANIFLMRDGAIKVGDLGLGRSLSVNTLEAFSKVGTPLYMAPEVLRSKGYDWKSDIWSLGCILYELAMLRSPFKEEGINLMRLFEKINAGTYPPLDTEKYSPQLCDLADAMISLNPAARPNIDQVCDYVQDMFDITNPKSARHGAVVDLPQIPKPLPWASLSDDQVGSSNQTVLEYKIHKPNTSRSTSKTLLDSDKKRDVKQSEQRDVEDSHREYSKTKGAGAALLVMDEVYELLKLLDYRGKDVVSPVQFAVDPDEAGPENSKKASRRHKQFMSFLKTCAWLLSKVSFDWKFDEMQSPHVQATSLLHAMKASGVSPEQVASLSPSQLTYGFGLAVCLALKWLAELVLFKHQRFKFTSPDYSTLKRMEQDAEIAQVETDLCVEEHKSDGDESEIEEDDLVADAEEVEFEAVVDKPSRVNSKSFSEGTIGKRFLLPMIENPGQEFAEKWNLELERLAPRLKAIQRKVDLDAIETWRTRLARLRAGMETLMQLSCRDHQKALSSSSSSSSSSSGKPLLSMSSERSIQQHLAALEELLTKELRVLERHETRLTSTFSHICQAYSDLKTKKSELNGILSERKQGVDQLLQIYEDVCSNVSEVGQALEARSESYSSTSGLNKLKSALASMKREIRSMDVKIGTQLVVVERHLAQERLHIEEREY